MRRNDWLLGQLPMGLLDDDFFIRFVSLFQDLATTLLDGVDNIPNAVDVTVAPAPMVRWLGSWIGVDNIDSSLPVGLQRRIVQESSQILSWRGTRRGLVQFLELVTGGPAVVEDSGGIFVAGDAGYRAPHVRMQVESTGWVREDDFVSLIVDELPANVTYEVWIRDRRLWPPLLPFESPTPPGAATAGAALGAASGTGAPAAAGASGAGRALTPASGAEMALAPASGAGTGLATAALSLSHAGEVPLAGAPVEAAVVGDDGPRPGLADGGVE